MNFAALSEALLHLPDLFIYINKSINYSSLHKIMFNLSNERRSLTAEADAIELARFRRQFFPVVHSSTFCKYVYDKPRGYADDYVTWMILQMAMLNWKPSSENFSNSTRIKLLWPRQKALVIMRTTGLIA